MQYSNIEEELVKLPKIFRETKNAPRFGVDY